MQGIVYLGISATVASVVVEIWRETQQRKLLWRLYALRDELRMLAIDDSNIAAASAFEVLDQELTDFCWLYRMHFLSFWHALYGLVVGWRDHSEQKSNPLAHCGGDARLERIYLNAIRAVGELLFWRHIALMLLLIPTVFPPILLWSNWKRVARYVFSETPRAERLARNLAPI
jgi:hypothetical protein